jgi:arsenate reductase
MPAPEKARVLFVCAENAARSQMAEGILRAHADDRFKAFSAGPDPGSVHPLAVRVMDEVGIDLSAHCAEPVGAYADTAMDYVVTLCDSTRELSPSIRAKDLVIHQPFDDPAALPDAERLDGFRRVRDELTDWIRRAFALKEPA